MKLNSPQMKRFTKSLKKWGFTFIIGSGAAVWLTANQLRMMYDTEDTLWLAGIVIVAGAGGKWLVKFDWKKASEYLESVIDEIFEDEDEDDTAVSTQAETAVNPMTPLDHNLHHSLWAEYVFENYKYGTRRGVNKFGVPAGVKLSRNQQEMLADFPFYGSYSHLSIIGDTGTGKAAVANQILVPAALSGYFQIVIFCESPKDYPVLRTLPNVTTISLDNVPTKTRGPVLKSLYQAFLGDVADEIDRRRKIATELGYDSIDAIPSNKWSRKKPTKILILFEEVGDMTLAVGDKNQEHLGRIAKIGRASSVCGIYISQRGFKDFKPALLTQTRRLVMRVANGKESYGALDEEGMNAHRLPVTDVEKTPNEVGMFYLKTKRTELFTSALVGKEDFLYLHRKHVEAGTIKEVDKPTWLSPDVRAFITHGRWEDDVKIPRKPFNIPSLTMNAPAPSPTVVPEQKTVASVTTQSRPIKPNSKIFDRPYCARRFAKGAFWGFRDVKDFVRGKPSLDVEKAIEIFDLLSLQSETLTKSQIVRLVFSGNGGNRELFYDLCEKHYKTTFTKHYRRMVQKAIILMEKQVNQ